MENLRVLQSTDMPQLLEQNAFVVHDDGLYTSKAWGTYTNKQSIVYMRIVRMNDGNELLVIDNNNTGNSKEIPMLQYIDYEGSFHMSCFACKGPFGYEDCFQEIEPDVFTPGKVYPFHILENNTLELLTTVSSASSVSSAPSTFSHAFQAYLDSKNVFKPNMLRFETNVFDMNNFEWNHQTLGLDPFKQVEIDYNYEKWFNLQFPWVCNSKRNAFMKLFFNTLCVKECYEHYIRCPSLRIQNIQWINQDEVAIGYIELRYTGFYEYVSPKLLRDKSLIIREHWKRDNEVQRNMAQCLIVKYNMNPITTQRFRTIKIEPVKVITDYNKLIQQQQHPKKRRKTNKKKKYLPYFGMSIKVYSQANIPYFGKSYYQNLPHLRSEIVINITNKNGHIYIKPYCLQQIEGLNRTLTDVLTKLF